MADCRYLDCEHFAGDVVELARDLIGRRLIVRSPRQELSGVIVETEAYGGPEDLASHASFRPGGRAATMFGPPGRIYVYSAYGVYPCLNIVTGPVGSPSAILIRGVHLAGADRPTHGPGRVTRALGVTQADHDLSVCGERFSISLERAVILINRTARIGITRGIDRPWRFVGALAASEVR